MAALIGVAAACSELDAFWRLQAHQLSQFGQVRAWTRAERGTGHGKVAGRTWYAAVLEEPGRGMLSESGVVAACRGMATHNFRSDFMRFNHRGKALPAVIPADHPMIKNGGI